MSGNRPIQLLSSIMIMLLIAFFDYWTEPELSLAPFYLISILQATWFVGKKAGIYLSVLSAALWLLVRYLVSPLGNSSLTLYWNTLMQLGIFLAATYLITLQLALKRSLEKEQELSRTDFLTGALNRRAFTEFLNTEVERSIRYRHHFSIAFIDLDNFKSVNDRHGHATGDSLLRTVVLTIRENIRSTDIVARLGGDEFVVLFPETGADAAESITMKVHSKLSEAMSRRDWCVTSSIGLVTYLDVPSSCDDVLNKAEQIMYLAKNGGKNRIERIVIK